MTTLLKDMLHGLETTAKHNTSVQRFNHELPFLDLGSDTTIAEDVNQQSWAALCTTINEALRVQAEHLFIEPDAMFWRMRTRCLDGYNEEILHDPQTLKTGLELLQTLLWGKDYESKPNRHTRFVLQLEGTEQAMGLAVLSTAKGDCFEFSLSISATLPPIMEQLGFANSQLRSIRQLMKQKTGLVVLAGPESAYLTRSLQALVQDAISPDRKMLFIAPEHEHSLPRTSQIEGHWLNQNHASENWHHALNQHFDTLMLSGVVPHHAFRQLSDIAQHSTLVVQAVQSNSIQSIMSLQNKGTHDAQHFYAQMSALIMLYPLRVLCNHCKTAAALTEQESAWLDQVRTPAAENVISWLTEGNTERYLSPVGCSECSDTGYSGNTSVFHVIQNPSSKLHFENSRKNENAHIPFSQSALSPLFKQLMSLVNAGDVPLREVRRVITLNTK